MLADVIWYAQQEFKPKLIVAPAETAQAEVSVASTVRRLSP